MRPSLSALERRDCHGAYLLRKVDAATFGPFVPRLMQGHGLVELVAQEVPELEAVGIEVV